MSAITSKETRQPLDYYATPNWMVQELLNHHSITGSILEPCAGEALAIASYLHDRDFKVFTSDVNPEVVSDFTFDATQKDVWERLPVVDWIVSNLPFNVADEILPLAYEHARIGVAVLLRCTYMESVLTGDRANWLASHPPCQIISIPRFAFTRSPKTNKWQTDSAPCFWYIWRKDGMQPKRSIVVVPWHQIKGFHRTPIEVIKEQ